MDPVMSYGTMSDDTPVLKSPGVKGFEERISDLTPGWEGSVFGC